PVSLDLAIAKFGGPDPGRIKFVNYGDPMIFNEHATNSPAIVPHAAQVNALAVGAVPYFNQDTPEATTSSGPSTILFTDIGDPIAPQIRQAPQIASIDG